MPKKTRPVKGAREDVARGRALRAARLRIGLSPGRLGARIGLPGSGGDVAAHVHSWETGKAMLTDPDLAAVERVLGVNLRDVSPPKKKTRNPYDARSHAPVGNAHRTNAHTVRFNDDEHTAVETAADEAALEPASWIRMVAVAATKHPEENGRAPASVLRAALAFTLELAQTWAREGSSADDAPTARAAYELLRKHDVVLR